MNRWMLKRVREQYENKKKGDMEKEKDKEQDELFDDVANLGTLIKENKPLLYIGGGRNNISIKVDKQGGTNVEIKPDEGKAMPKEMLTPEATEILTKLQKAGFLDENFQPQNLSRPKVAIMAHFIANVLAIKNMWSLFGEWWNMNAMSAAYNTGMNQPGTADFMTTLENLQA